MNEWYEEVGPATPLTQGDFVFQCPVPTWNRVAFAVSKDEKGNIETLKTLRDVRVADVVVMTQACDLAGNKLLDVTLCPHISLTDYRVLWEGAMRAAGQGPSERAFGKECENIKKGEVWHKSMLNQDENLGLEHRIVDFHDVFTLPRSFLEQWINATGKNRPRLLPPYREHLSQAFARFYMRVGLPTTITPAWQIK